MSGERVPFPMFELVGPKCDQPDCTGVKVSTVNLYGEKMHFNKCSKCGVETERTPAAQKLAWTLCTIDWVLKGG